MQAPSKLRWDIFCTVIDNFGDIGVCWRLARALSTTETVRLWVDDLISFQRICPALDPRLSCQILYSVEIRAWPTPFLATDSVDIVIEAFACEIPETYLYAMAACPPVWINLDYLSAQAWVNDYHGLPSPHPQLPLTKYFFFPGFTSQTGGIVIEPDNEQKRLTFLAQGSDLFLQSLGLTPRQENECLVSLFCYPNDNLTTLLTAWSQSRQAIRCLMPDSHAAQDMASFFNQTQLHIGKTYQQGALQLHVLPFIPQTQYDELLWACDINFVRGEDSFVRAQLAGKPMIWHIYPQEAHIHLEKLAAFLTIYPLNHGFMQAWNQPQQLTIDHWDKLYQQHSQQRLLAENWRQQLHTHGNLALNLIQFCQNKLK
jgi:uncharacterized repeat protein (TIGR03837 family)